MLMMFAKALTMYNRLQGWLPIITYVRDYDEIIIIFAKLFNSYEYFTYIVF